MKMDVSTAFLIIMLIFAMGDIIGVKTKAVVPSIFVASVLFLIGFWTFIPGNIRDLGGLGSTIGALSTYLIVINMGTTIRFNQLKKQWKTLLTALLGMIGLAIGVLTIGSKLAGWDIAVVGAPTLSGGLIAALIMQEAALAKGLTAMATLAILVMVTQGFFGYPLATICLKKEGKRLLEDYRKMTINEREVLKEVASSEEKHKLIPSLPKKYITDNTLLLSLAFLGWIAVILSNLTNGAIPKTIMCLFMGIIGAELGLIEPQALAKSKSSGFIMVAQLMHILSGLVDATPQMVLSMIVPLLIIVATGIIGLSLVSIFIGTKLGYSKQMSFAVGLNALLGFPPNYIITNDVSTVLAETPEEKEFLMDKMLPDMLIAGFTTVTIGSVVLAGFCAKLL